MPTKSAQLNADRPQTANAVVKPQAKGEFYRMVKLPNLCVHQHDAYFRTIDLLGQAISYALLRNANEGQTNCVLFSYI
nr:hypothetical transcript [Hymenolepis microstoma]